METKWKYRCKDRKYTLVLIFHNWLWAGGKCHQSWWMPPPAQIEKLTILTWPIWDGSTAPSFVISHHNSMSRLSLSNPPSALIFIVLKVDTGSCLRFVTKWILVQIYGSIFGRAPSMKHKIATKTPAMQFCQWLRWQNRFSRLEDLPNSLQCCFCWWLRLWNRYLGLQDWKRISQGNTLQ